MSKPIAWSYTALTKFENCPKQYYHVKVAKDWNDVQGEEALWGDRVHKALEYRVKDGTPLPEGMTQWEPIAAKFASAPGQVFTEQQLAITKNFEPTTWFGKDVWCRAIVDVGSVNGNKIVALDWKTGRRKADSTQLKLFAGVLFAHYPQVDTIYTGFVWLKEPPATMLDRDKFKRDDKHEIWQEFLPRVRRLEVAYEESKWPARPSGLCGWCPVKSCTYWKERK